MIPRTSLARSAAASALLLAALALLGGAGPATPPSAATDARSALLLQLPSEWDPGRASDKERNVLGLFRDRLARDRTLVLTVTGHTDLIGTPDQNLAIGFFYAERLAREVSARFGIPVDRIEVRSAGEAQPLVASGSYASQAANRRVVLALGAPAAEPVAAAADVPARRQVVLLEPPPGTVDRAYQRVRAIVQGRSSTALLTLNGSSTVVAVQEGRVDGEVVLANGGNTIEVTAWDENGTLGRDRVEVTYVPPPPAIEVRRPLDGELFDTTNSPVVQVEGRVLSTTPLKEAFMFLNGVPRRIEVASDGTFSQPVVLISRDNRLRIEAISIYEKAATSPEISVSTVNLNPKDLVVFLTWDKPDIDLDLHVFGPDGRHTFYGALDPFESREAIPGGGLDIDDRNGFGPEVFTLQGGRPGSYAVQATYHHSPANEPCMATVTVVLNPSASALRMVRVFGPVRMSPGDAAEWDVTSIEMPSGTFASQ